MGRTMIFLASLMLFSVAEAEASCDETSALRIESARSLLGELDEVADARKAMQVERARILLEKVISAQPKCAEATKLKREADRLFEEVEVLSSNAAAGQVLERAERLLIALEETESPERSELQAVRFLIAALAQRLPDEPKVLDLATRARAVGEAK